MKKAFAWGALVFSTMAFFTMDSYLWNLALGLSLICLGMSYLFS